MRDAEICVTVNGEKRHCAAGTLLSQLLPVQLPCGGHGRCGKCKVIAKGALSPVDEVEKKHLSDAELSAGVRLACRSRAMGECVVADLPEREEKILTAGKTAVRAASPAFSSLGVAIDIGTTTLAARMIDRDGNVLAECGELNPQEAFGADVISRIEAALAGKGSALAETVVGALDRILCTLAGTAGRDPSEIDGMAVTGNTAMLHFLTKTSPEPLSHAPFAVEKTFGETVGAGSLGFTSVKPETPVYLPPCISAFLGADTVCALLATGLCDGSATAMLADIGTNGEMALWHGGKLTACSTAAGPAFEGVGISMGMRGSTGAVDRVTSANGRLFAHVIGGGTPVGICGSGLVDAVACLLREELLDETGSLDDDPAEIIPPVVLTQGDIRAVQLAKSAVCAGMRTLLHRAGIGGKSVSALYVAGGFGTYLKPENASAIGLLPPELLPHLSAVGNAALDGATMLLADTGLRPRAQKLASDAETLELSTDPFFSDAFVEGMLFE